MSFMANVVKVKHHCFKNDRKKIERSFKKTNSGAIFKITYNVLIVINHLYRVNVFYG